MATNMDMSQLAAPAIAAGNSVANQGLAQGKDAMDLASTMQDIQMKQQKQQEMQQQLQDAQYKTVTGTTQTAMSMSDPIFKVSEAAMEKRLKQVNPDYQEGTLAALRSDPDLRAGVTAHLTALATGKIPIDPTTQKATISAFGDPGQLEQLVNVTNEQRKLEASANIKEAQIEANKRIAAGHDTSKVTAAGITANGAGGRAVNPITAGNAYSKEIGPSENAVMQANRATGIIDKIQAGDLKSTKTLAADLDSAQASLLGGGKPSTVYGQQAVHMDDIYSRAANTIQFLSSSPQDTQSPAKLAQLKLDVEALRNFYDEQHQQKYNSWRQTLAAQPDQRSQNVLKGLDNRYSTFRKAQGMDTSFGGQAPAAAGPATQGTPATTGGMSQNQQDFIIKAQALKNPATGQPYTMTEIQQKMQQKGIK